MFPWKQHSHLKLKGCKGIKTRLIMFFKSLKEKRVRRYNLTMSKIISAGRRISLGFFLFRQTDVFVLRATAVQPEQCWELLRHAGQLGSGEHRGNNTQYVQQWQWKRRSGHGAVRRSNHQQLWSLSDWRKLHGWLHPSHCSAEHQGLPRHGESVKPHPIRSGQDTQTYSLSSVICLWWNQMAVVRNQYDW